MGVPAPPHTSRKPPIWLPNQLIRNKEGRTGYVCGHKAPEWPLREGDNASCFEDARVMVIWQDPRTQDCEEATAGNTQHHTTPLLLKSCPAPTNEDHQEGTTNNNDRSEKDIIELVPRTEVYAALDGMWGGAGGELYHIEGGYVIHTLPDGGEERMPIEYSPHTLEDALLPTRLRQQRSIMLKCEPYGTGLVDAQCMCIKWYSDEKQSQFSDSTLTHTWRRGSYVDPRLLRGGWENADHWVELLKDGTLHVQMHMRVPPQPISVFYFGEDAYNAFQERKRNINNKPPPIIGNNSAPLNTSTQGYRIGTGVLVEPLCSKEWGGKQHNESNTETPTSGTTWHDDGSNPRADESDNSEQQERQRQAMSSVEVPRGYCTNNNNYDNYDNYDNNYDNNNYPAMTDIPRAPDVQCMPGPSNYDNYDNNTNNTNNNYPADVRRMMDARTTIAAQPLAKPTMEHRAKGLCAPEPRAHGHPGFDNWGPYTGTAPAVTSMNPQTTPYTGTHAPAVTSMSPPTTTPYTTIIDGTPLLSAAAAGTTIINTSTPSSSSSNYPPQGRETVCSSRTNTSGSERIDEITFGGLAKVQASDRSAGRALKLEECFVKGKLAHVFLGVEADADSDAIDNARKGLLRQIGDKIGSANIVGSDEYEDVKKAHALMKERSSEYAACVRQVLHEDEAPVVVEDEAAACKAPFLINGRYAHDVLGIRYGVDRNLQSNALMMRRAALEEDEKEQARMESRQPRKADEISEYEECVKAFTIMGEEGYAKKVKKDGYEVTKLPPEWTVDKRWPHEILNVDPNMRFDQIENAYEAFLKDLRKGGMKNANDMMQKMRLDCAKEIMCDNDDGCYIGALQKYNPEALQAQSSNHVNTGLVRASSANGRTRMGSPSPCVNVGDTTGGGRELPFQAHADYGPPRLPEREENHDEVKQWYLKEMPAYGPEPETLLAYAITKRLNRNGINSSNPLPKECCSLKNSVGTKDGFPVNLCREKIRFSFKKNVNDPMDHEYQVVGDWVQGKGGQKQAHKDACAEALALWRINPPDYAGAGYKGGPESFPARFRDRTTRIKSYPVQDAEKQLGLPDKGRRTWRDVERAYHHHFREIARSARPDKHEAMMKLKENYKTIMDKFPSDNFVECEPPRASSLATKDALMNVEQSVKCAICPDNPIIRSSVSDHISPIMHHLTGKTHLKECAKKLWPYSPQHTVLYPSYVKYQGMTLDSTKVQYLCTVCDTRHNWESMEKHLEGADHLVQLAKKIEQVNGSDGFYPWEDRKQLKMFKADFPQLASCRG